MADSFAPHHVYLSYPELLGSFIDTPIMANWEMLEWCKLILLKTENHCGKSFLS